MNAFAFFHSPFPCPERCGKATAHPSPPLRLHPPYLPVIRYGYGFRDDAGQAAVFGGDVADLILIKHLMPVGDIVVLNDHDLFALADAAELFAVGVGLLTDVDRS